MLPKNLIHLLMIIQFPLICTSHGAHDVILSPTELSGKYVKFNRLIEMTTKVPWEEPLKESAKIALSSPNISKDSLLRAPYVGIPKHDSSSAFGDIVILAKGKLKKFSNETYLFEEIHDVCEYQCQNNADKYLENVTALWMVERIRHRDSERGYRYDLKFTIVPIFAGRNALIKSNNLEERLRNILKKTFILRDTDYPKYFQQITPKIARRADINRSMAGYVSHNQVMHPVYSNYVQAAPKMNLNMGEFYKKPAYMIPKPPSLNNYYAPNVNNRYPIRFPDSRENVNAMKAAPYKMKPVKDDEEKQEAHIINNIVDHRGAVHLNNKPFHPNTLNTQAKPQQLPARSTNLYVSQPAILLPQMPISLIHVAPYPLPLQLQVSTPPNQMIYAAQPDVTTFRYPTYFNSHQSIPQFQYIQNKTSYFKESEPIVKSGFSLPDPMYHPTTTSSTEHPIIYPTMYTPKLSNYVTASSIQINSYDNNDFQPIVAPYSSYSSPKSSVKKIIFESEEKKATKYSNRPSRIDRIKPSISPITTTTSTTESSTVSEYPKNQQLDYANYDIVATRPSMTKRTTEKPILKWLPKRHRNKTLSNVATYTTIAPLTSSATAYGSSIESTSSTSVVYPSVKASTHSQIFRGRNRFYSNNSNKRNSTTSTVATEKSSTTLSSSLNNPNLKHFKRKATTTTLLPITTTQLPPSSGANNAYTSTVFPTYSVTSPTETKEAVTSLSYSTSISQKQQVDTTASYDSYELIPAGVETINSNSSNIKIYKASASEEDDVHESQEKIDEITSTILKHAKSVGDDAKKTTIK